MLQILPLRQYLVFHKCALPHSKHQKTERQLPFLEHDQFALKRVLRALSLHKG